MKDNIDSNRLIALQVSQGASWGSFPSVLVHTSPVMVSRITQMLSRADCSCPIRRAYSLNAQFVFLSACQTGTGDGFSTSLFISPVGFCSQDSRASSLFRDGRVTPDLSDVPRALHRAVLKLQESVFRLSGGCSLSI